MTLTEAQIRAAELREHWLQQPENYQPPRNAPFEAIMAWDERWRRSLEFAHIKHLFLNVTFDRPSGASTAK